MQEDLHGLDPHCSSLVHGRSRKLVPTLLTVLIGFENRDRHGSPLPLGDIGLAHQLGGMTGSK